VKRVAVTSLGCKVNACDSEAMQSLFVHSGYEPVDFDDTADVYLINTCTVTHISDRKSRQLIRRAAAANPGAAVVVTGCLAQARPEEMLSIPGGGVVMGTCGQANIVHLTELYLTGRIPINAVRDVNKRQTYEELPVNGPRNRTRAFLKIEDGCGNDCAYCVIPRVRGPVVSRALADIKREAESIGRDGFKEVVITGIEIASYGLADGAGLIDVAEHIASVDGIERLRFGSLPPTVFTHAFLSRLARVPKVCDHFHIPLQSGCDRTLERMNRLYTADEYRAAVNRVYEYYPDAGVTTDVIAGFPGETDADFDASFSFCEQIPFLKMHVFPYSRRPGTAAASMDGQAPEAVRKERARRLIALSDRHGAAFCKRFAGRMLPVLFEGPPKARVYEGYTENYMRVTRKSAEDLAGRIIDVCLP